MKLTWTRHLRCPKCGGEFDYEFVPGASFTALRLGNARFMRCPLCHKFATFPMSRNEPEGTDTTPGSEAAVLPK
jgi:hypothetical protein